MKRCCAFIALCFLLAVLGGGCGEEGRERGHDVFYSEKHSFECMEQTAASALSFFDLALRLNACMLPDGRFCSDSVKRYLPGYSLLPGDQNIRWGIKARDTVFILVCDGQNLGTLNSRWEIGGLEWPYRGSLVMQCTGFRKWNVSVSAWNAGGWLSLAGLVIRYSGGRPASGFAGADWSIEGYWCSLLADKCYMDFDIVRPLMCYSESSSLFEQGLVFVRRRDLCTLQDELLRVELSPRGKGRILDISRMHERMAD